MPRATVEAILGGPPRDERTAIDAVKKRHVENLIRVMHDVELQKHVSSISVKANSNLNGIVKVSLESWRTDDAEIVVEFDEQGRVWCIHVEMCGPPQERPLVTLRRWLRL
jgi:hypothetical protein